MRTMTKFSGQNYGIGRCYREVNLDDEQVIYAAPTEVVEQVISIMKQDPGARYFTFYEFSRYYAHQRESRLHESQFIILDDCTMDVKLSWQELKCPSGFYPENELVKCNLSEKDVLDIASTRFISPRSAPLTPNRTATQQRHRSETPLQEPPEPRASSRSKSPVQGPCHSPGTAAGAKR